MDDFILRKHIKEVISEFFNNSWVYTYGPNKFPKFDGSEKTPSDLDAEADSLNDDLEEFEKNEDFKKSIIPNKH